MFMCVHDSLSAELSFRRRAPCSEGIDCANEKGREFRATGGEVSHVAVTLRQTAMKRTDSWESAITSSSSELAERTQSNYSYSAGNTSAAQAVNTERYLTDNRRSPRRRVSLHVAPMSSSDGRESIDADIRGSGGQADSLEGHSGRLQQEEELSLQSLIANFMS